MAHGDVPDPADRPAPPPADRPAPEPVDESSPQSGRHASPPTDLPSPSPPGGPLRGLRVVQVAGLGPVPYAARMLAELGAEVIRVERPGAPADWSNPDPAGDLVELDLGTPPGRARLLELIRDADVLMEGFRPGVAERLGFGPQECLAANPGLVFARMTGWGQQGPLAGSVGHDINYLALTGVLHAIGGEREGPVPPLNLVGDFGGGSMLLLVGILAALWERDRSGGGQVVDAAMVDGVSVLARMIHSLQAGGRWHDRRGANLLDGGAPFYRTYRCADDEYLAVGALEPRFYAAFVHGLGLDPAALADRDDETTWPRLQAEFATVIAGRTRDEWTAVFAGTDACVTPVLSLREAVDDPHLRARGTFTAAGYPAPAPRFSRTRTFDA